MPSTTRRFTRSSEHGFTLVELLVVILVIGILAAIAIPLFLTQRKAAVDAAVKSDLRNALTFVNQSKKELFADQETFVRSIFILNSGDGVKAYNSLTDYSDEAYPVGEYEIELPEAMKSIRLSEGTAMSVSGNQYCDVTISANNRGGNESHPGDDNDFFAGGYIYMDEVGEIHPEHDFWLPGGPYDVATSRPEAASRPVGC